MNVVIIEGLDNTGKSTLINSLKEHFEDLGKRVELIHCKAPEGDTLEEKAKWQDKHFTDLAKDAIRAKKLDRCDVMMFDRAWYGEYAYGQIYRHRDRYPIEMNINSIEDSLNYFFSPDELSFILLDVDDLEFCVKNDDGKSISKCDLTKIKKEKQYFEEVYGMSWIPNKCLIMVNNGKYFKPKYELFKEALSIIHI